MYLAIPRMSNIWFFSFHFRAQEQSFKSRAKEYKANKPVHFILSTRFLEIPILKFKQQLSGPLSYQEFGEKRARAAVSFMRTVFY